MTKRHDSGSATQCLQRLRLKSLFGKGWSLEWFCPLSTMRKPYSTDLSDDEWICLRSYLLNTLGLLLSAYVSQADVQDRGGAQGLLAGLKLLLPRLKKIWADGAYTGEKLAGWCKEQGEW